MQRAKNWFNNLTRKEVTRIILILVFCLSWIIMRERGNQTAVNYLFQNAQNMHNGISKIKISWSGFNPFQYTTIGVLISKFTMNQIVQTLKISAILQHYT